MGYRRVTTHGYSTHVNGLDVIRVIGPDKKFCIVQTISGLSIGVYFHCHTRAVKFANKYLKDFDFTQYANDLLRDGSLGKCVYNAKIMEGL